jgi:protein-S-isoprenylcysteine O-methyltransferase Ste14
MTIDGQTIRKIKLAIAATAKTIRRTRVGRAALAGVQATAHSLGNVLHQLWLEVTGFTFLAIAAIGALAAIREYGKYQTNHAIGSGRLLLAVCFTVSFAWFGVTSFWRVSRKKLKARN